MDKTENKGSGKLPSDEIKKVSDFKVASILIYYFLLGIIISGMFSLIEIMFSKS